MSVKEITNNLETKEGLLNLLLQIINDKPNDTDLGKAVRNTFKNDLLDNQ